MNRYARFQYRHQAFPPIADRSTESNVSLESALEPVLPLVEQLNDFIRKAKRSCNRSSPHKLTIDESAAIYLYSDEWNDQSLHHLFNDALQSDDRTKLEPWLNFLHLFKNAMNKLPTVKQTLWRCLPRDIAYQFRETEEIVCWNITSCSLLPSDIKKLVNEDLVLCKIDPLNAKDIRGYICDDGDEDALLLPGTRLRVKSAGQILELEEIDEVKDDCHPLECSQSMSISQPASENEDVEQMIVEQVSESEMHATELIDDQSKEVPSHSIEDLSIVTFINGDQYEVFYGKDGKEGSGKFTTIDGQMFQGHDADQRAEGEGICVLPNGDRFIGTFRCGKRYGYGLLYTTSKEVQIVHFPDDKIVEICVKIASDQPQYEWRNRNDEERFYTFRTDHKGNKYIGAINGDGQADGLGIRIWADASRYEGFFKDDKKHGYGTFFYTDRDTYMGQWSDDEINGRGILKWTSGTFYQGDFLNGKRHGQGKLTFANDRQQDGQWNNDIYICAH